MNGFKHLWWKTVNAGHEFIHLNPSVLVHQQVVPNNYVVPLLLNPPKFSYAILEDLESWLLHSWTVEQGRQQVVDVPKRRDIRGT
jgi:hypothetical protein